ncbi:hypothetical protein PUV54_11615 [Hyphococcus flavus]|uniref:PAS domain-containing protein n=1 Tax=Hyphococcus flavus TaxID=1866326 RepID=A0AAE9ZDP2_9PROT|nr:hypothetical protein [Hyphococcus flavus]WDI30602.1 hypothetical protein PUV54_11615 [Hyphococcus flavus]
MHSEVLEKPVRVTERRLTERIRQKWATLARGRLPSLREIENLNLGLDRDYCFAVDLRLSDILPYFVFMGDELSRYSTLYPMGDPRREKTLLDTAIGKIDEAALTRQPVNYDAVTRLDNGRRIAFRTILLPVAENGRDVSHVFGAAKGKGI